MSVKRNEFDYIIAGTGCAGLSLAMQLKNSGVNFSKILLVDREVKNKNDRTWCFWTQENNAWYESLIIKKWSQFKFSGSQFQLNLSISPYTYNLIRGEDFYSYCMTELKNDDRFVFTTEEIISIISHGKSAELTTVNGQYSAPLLFNSVFRITNAKKTDVNFVQHFKGWRIQTPEPLFNADCPVFMDFSVPQENDCRFVYVIPFSKTEALVEYTGFSPAPIPDEDYEKHLKSYIKTNLNISNYSVLEKESGIIPMYESAFVNAFGKNVVNIGTAGGDSKPSTGFTFYFIQKHVDWIIKCLKSGEPLSEMKRGRFLLYDKILLQVLNEKKISGKEIFSALFKKNKTTDLLAFLNEESSIAQEIKIMNSVPLKIFVKASLKKLVQQFFN